MPHAPVDLHFPDTDAFADFEGSDLVLALGLTVVHGSLHLPIDLDRVGFSDHYLQMNSLPQAGLSGKSPTARIASSYQRSTPAARWGADDRVFLDERPEPRFWCAEPGSAEALCRTWQL